MEAHLPIDDVLALGAAAMPDAALVSLIVGDLSRARAAHLAAALLLDPHARAEVLRHEPEGPTLLAALELGRRAAIAPFRASSCVRGPADVAALALPRLPVDEERLFVVALDARRRPARAFVTGNGDAGSVDVAPARVLGPVLACGATRFAVAHRHLDTRAAPSRLDVDATRALALAAATVGLALVDHVVIGDDGFVSMAREGHLARTRGYG